MAWGHDNSGAQRTAFDAGRCAASVLVAFDDTDDAEGGCTTAMVATLLAAVPHLALRGMPRLVRLNPNVPMKTRGNGALCIELVHPEGPRVQVGMWDGVAIHAYPDGRHASGEEGETLWDALRTASRPGARPALAVLPEAPTPIAYHEAVTSRVEAAAAGRLLEAGGGRIFYVEEQGLAGVMGAAAWPGPATSHELIAYRSPERVGGPRDIDARALMALDADGTTFHSGDGENDVPCCVPHTPCPVLAGLRGLDPERLVETALPALHAASGEPIRGWLLFASNQASGDHVTPVAHVGEAPEWGTLAVAVTVAEAPRDIAGGHVVVACHDTLGHEVDLVAYEPTKGFRRHARAVRIGDRVLAVGAWDAGSLRLERFRVDSLAEPFIKEENPRCPVCQRSMKSRGTDAGYRCPEGHGSAPEAAAVVRRELRKLRPGWYEVPVMARRHLHRPLMFEVLA